MGRRGCLLGESRNVSNSRINEILTSFLCGPSDTLFQGGCGRFFEGTPEEMHAALTYLGKLPDETIVYNGHEYTPGNVKFGLKIEPVNEDIKRQVPESDVCMSQSAV